MILKILLRVSSMLAASTRGRIYCPVEFIRIYYSVEFISDGAPKIQYFI